jgi:hypothetical protein
MIIATISAEQAYLVTSDVSLLLNTRPSDIRTMIASIDHTEDFLPTSGFLKGSTKNSKDINPKIRKMQPKYGVESPGCAVMSPEMITNKALLMRKRDSHQKNFLLYCFVKEPKYP